MKFPRLRGLLVLLALGCPAFSAHALNPALFNDGFAPLTPALAQFFTDLEAIPTGSTVSDAQHQTLLADLAALPPGPAAPDAATLDELATNFGSVAVAGLVDDDLEYQLAMDFDVDPDDPDSWLVYVQGDVLSALNPPAAIDPNAPGEDGGSLPVETFVPTVAALVNPGVVVTREFVPLQGFYDTVARLSPIIYDGSVQMVTRTQAGSPTTVTLHLHTDGLPAGETYTLSLVRQSDGARVVIGTFSPQTFVSEPAGGATLTLAYPQRTYLNTDSDETLGTGTSQPLPTGFDANDVKTLVVTNAEGRVRLKQKLLATNAEVIHRRQVSLHLYHPAAGGAGGKVTVSYTLGAYGGIRNRLRLQARHLPASTPLTLLVDGVKVDTYTTTPDGQLVIAQRSTASGSVHPYDTPNVNPQLAGVDLSNAQAVSLVDAAGNVVLSGSL